MLMGLLDPVAGRDYQRKVRAFNNSSYYQVDRSLADKQQLFSLPTRKVHIKLTQLCVTAREEVISEWQVSMSITSAPIPKPLPVQGDPPDHPLRTE
jgi:hypothetical protein